MNNINVNNILATDIVGVAQAHCGHYYRWLFTKEEVNRQFKENDIDLELEDDIAEDILWPMGGSNSTATSFTLFESDEDIKKYLTTPEPLDSEDPMLVEIAEYMCDPCIDGDDGDITYPYMEKLGLSYEECSFREDEDKLYTLVNIMSFELIRKHCWEYGHDAFYGESSDMSFSELSDLYEKVTGVSIETLKRVYVEKKYVYDLKKAAYTCFCTGNFSIIPFFAVPFSDGDGNTGTFYLNEDRVFKNVDGVEYNYAYGDSTDEDFVRTDVLAMLEKSDDVFHQELERHYYKCYEDFIKSMEA